MRAPAFYRDREDLAKAQKYLDDGWPDHAWELLRLVLIRHPWRPKRVRRKLRKGEASLIFTRLPRKLKGRR